MTSSMTSQGGLVVGPLYSFINEMITFFMITKQRAKISSLNFLCICIIRLWLQLYENIFMTSLITSPGHEIGQILKFIYLRQYFNYSVDQNLKMSEMLMATFLVYSPSGITSGKKNFSRAQNGGHFENFEILNTASIWPQIWKYRPKLYQKKYFHDDDVIDDVTGWPQSFSLYSCLGEVGFGSKLQIVSLINANIIIVFLGYTCQTIISMNYTFRDCRSKFNITGLLGDLGTNKQHCKLSQILLFFRLWRHR